MNGKWTARVLGCVMGVGLLASGTNIAAKGPIAWWKNDVSTKKKIGSCLFLGAFARMIYKAEKELHTTFYEDMRMLRRGQFKSPQDRIKCIARILVDLVDNKLIGSSGKKGGIRIEGSKVVWEGKECIKSDGIIVRKDLPPYGFMGCSWAYVAPLFSELKKLIDGCEAIRRVDGVLDLPGDFIG